MLRQFKKGACVTICDTSTSSGAYASHGTFKVAENIVLGLSNRRQTAGGWAWQVVGERLPDGRWVIGRGRGFGAVPCRLLCAWLARGGETVRGPEWSAVGDLEARATPLASNGRPRLTEGLFRPVRRRDDDADARVERVRGLSVADMAEAIRRRRREGR